MKTTTLPAECTDEIAEIIATEAGVCGGMAESIYRKIVEAHSDTSFQPRVKPWMDACFGEKISMDRLERKDRFAEEALELLQSLEMPKERILALVDYVYGREVGYPPQEVGGTMVTLAALCLAHGMNMHALAETELARIWTKVESIREKQRNKPTGSALPIAVDKPRRVRHKKRGSEYAVDSLGVAQISTMGGGKPFPLGFVHQRTLREGDTMVVYKDSAGRTWLRFPDEFEDGRFEDVI